MCASTLHYFTRYYLRYIYHTHYTMLHYILIQTPIYIDRRCFKIEWWENDAHTEIHELEYICDSIKDCAELYAKLAYLLSRLEIL